MDHAYGMGRFDGIRIDDQDDPVISTIAQDPPRVLPLGLRLSRDVIACGTTHSPPANGSAG
jgi:hypothetical protein